MPRTEFRPENKGKSAYDYPKLQLDQGERARIVMAEQAPDNEYVHTLRTPKMLNGQVLRETVNRFGSMVEQVAYNFEGRVVCLGTPEALEKSGMDVSACPACEAAAETDAIKPPERRFAIHVIHYVTVPGGFDVAQPFSVRLEAWLFNGKIFNDLVDIAHELSDDEKETGDLRTKDLLLGPCENKQFQKFKFRIAGKAVWMSSPEYKQIVKTTFQEQRSPDLLPLLANKVGLESMKSKVAAVQEANRAAFGDSSATPVDDTVDTSEIDGLLGDDDAPAKVAEPVVSVDLDALAATEVPTAPKDEPGEDLDLEAILGEGL